ncbi:unnamed protein product [Colias eurytheme]|nr:unnamed protein product [Colias eurytheme]
MAAWCGTRSSTSVRHAMARKQLGMQSSAGNSPPLSLAYLPSVMSAKPYYEYGRSGHAGRGERSRGVMRRAGDWVAWPAAACVLLLACDCACAIEMVAPGSECCASKYVL